MLEVKCKGEIYAAKKYDFDPRKLSDNLQAFSREHEILTRIRHKNIVSYFGICKLVEGSAKSVVIAMERMEKDLSTHLGEKEIDLPTKFRILRDVASGLHHLHSQIPIIIHRDLTASNILLTSDGVAKIGDFGNSRIVDLCSKSDPLTSRPGTGDYMPQEALEHTYTEKLDIFSYGHLAIHIIIQERPKLLPYSYKKDGHLIARTEVQRREKHLESLRKKLGGDEHPFYIMVIQCLDDEPKKRPGCKEILECIETNRLMSQV